MTKQEISPLFLIIGAVVVLGAVILFFYKASSPPVPPAGSYTPGVPPWMEKNRPQSQSGVHNAPSTPQSH